MEKVEFFGGKNFFLKVLVEGLNIIQLLTITQFSLSKNEGNPKLLVYLVIYGCCGVFPASIELKQLNGNALFRGGRLDLSTRVQTIQEREGQLSQYVIT